MHGFHTALFKHDTDGFLEGEVDGIVGIWNVEQQISSRLHGLNFNSLLDECFLLILHVYRSLPVFAEVLSNVRSSCCSSCFHLVLSWILFEDVSSSASVQHQLVAVVALGWQLVMIGRLRHNSSCLLCSVFRQCATGVLCCPVWVMFKSVVCVSWLVRLLPVSKFSLRQSVF